MKSPLPFGLVAALTIAASVVIASTARAQVIYTNDFQANSNGFSNTARESLPTDAAGFSSSNNSLFAGRFGAQTVSLSLSGLTSGVPLSISFDLFIGATWDGNATAAGPDFFILQADGVDLINATFITHFPSDNVIDNYTQSYSDTNLIGPGAFDPFTGADVAQTQFMGNTYFDRYGIYYFGHGVGNPVLFFTPTTSTATLSFRGAGLQDTSNEFWALDNVTVSVAAAPEPGSVVLVAVGLLGMSTFPIAEILLPKSRKRRS